MTKEVAAALLALGLYACSIDDRTLLVNDPHAGSVDASGIELCSGAPHGPLITDFSALQGIESALPLETILRRDPPDITGVFGTRRGAYLLL